MKTCRLIIWQCAVLCIICVSCTTRKIVNSCYQNWALTSDKVIGVTDTSATILKGKILDKSNSGSLEYVIEVTGQKKHKNIITDQTGDFSVRIPSGNYRLSLNTGYKEISITNLKLNPGEIRELIITIQPVICLE